MTNNKSFDINKWLGWLTALSMLIGWTFSLGIFYNKITTLEGEVKQTNLKIEKVQDALLEQKEFNGKVLTYIELTSEE